jgi:hypothetical protein
MSDAPAKKRPWFQCSLATAIVMMFVAAGLLWLNMRDRLETVWVPQYGWLFVAAEKPLIPSVIPGPPTITDPAPNRIHVSVVGVVADCIVALTILCLAGVLCEWRIRCKERQNEFRMDDVPKKRPFFQYHLSTAIIVTMPLRFPLLALAREG